MSSKLPAVPVDIRMVNNLVDGLSRAYAYSGDPQPAGPDGATPQPEHRTNSMKACSGIANAT